MNGILASYDARKSMRLRRLFCSVLSFDHSLFLCSEALRGSGMPLNGCTSYDVLIPAMPGKHFLRTSKMNPSFPRDCSATSHHPLLTQTPRISNATSWYSLCSVTLGLRFPTYKCARLCCSAMVPNPPAEASCGAAVIVLASGVADMAALRMRMMGGCGVNGCPS